MRYRQIVEHVQKIAGFKAPEDAQKAISAVSEALAERLSGGLMRKVASQLPKEISSVMDSVPRHEVFGLQEFFNLVAGKLGTAPAEAMHHAEAVLAVLQDAAPVEIWEQVYPELDPEYRKFIDSSAVTGKREGFLIGRVRKSLGRSDKTF